MAGLGAAQLHGQETAEETQWVRARVPTVIKAFRAGDPAIARFEDFGADYLLVDGDNPGSGQVFDWRLAEGVADHHRLIVSGGLRPDNVAQAVAHLRPAGVDVSTGVESAPGRKDPLLVRAFIVNAREADAEPADPRPSGPRPRGRGALRLEGRMSDESSLMGRPGCRRPVRRVRGPLRPGGADAGLPRAREVVRRRLGRPGLPRRARRPAAPLRRAVRRR